MMCEAPKWSETRSRSGGSQFTKVHQHYVSLMWKTINSTCREMFPRLECLSQIFSGEADPSLAASEGLGTVDFVVLKKWPDASSRVLLKMKNPKKIKKGFTCHLIYITSWRRSKMPQYFYGWDQMDPSSANNFSMPKTSKTLVPPSCLPLSRPCFGLLLLLPPGQLNAHPTSRKTTAKIGRSTWCLRASPCGNLEARIPREWNWYEGSQQISLISIDFPDFNWKAKLRILSIFRAFSRWSCIASKIWAGNKLTG